MNEFTPRQYSIKPYSYEALEILFGVLGQRNNDRSVISTSQFLLARDGARKPNSVPFHAVFLQLPEEEQSVRIAAVREIESHYWTSHETLNEAQVELTNLAISAITTWTAIKHDN